MHAGRTPGQRHIRPVIDQHRHPEDLHQCVDEVDQLARRTPFQPQL
jgi:hypothetical protein